MLSGTKIKNNPASLRLLSLLLGMLVAFAFSQSIKVQEQYCPEFELAESIDDDSEIQNSDSWDVFNLPFQTNHSVFEFAFPCLNSITVRHGLNFIPCCNISRALLFKQLKISSH